MSAVCTIYYSVFNISMYYDCQSDDILKYAGPGLAGFRSWKAEVNNSPADDKNAAISINLSSEDR